MTTEGEVPQTLDTNAHGSMITVVMEKHNSLKGCVALMEGSMSTMGGRVDSMEGRDNSIISTPHLYYACLSGYAQNTSTTISLGTLHQMFNLPRPPQDPTI